ncbi:polymorphic toxin-type HINT domain-containing protein [Paenibacillus sp. FSL H7-0357]|uniref:polymorphic toxin-type HINT domain-containing protein n=1 Tax=Paenibacillus sp. FSL H7-0357 TaxID=1536774 RepID=UPI0009DD5FA6
MKSALIVRSKDGTCRKSLRVQNLKVGDLLVSSDGTKLAIDKIEIAPRQATVYNFMVADYHSYFVSNLGIWVHNCTILLPQVRISKVIILIIKNSLKTPLAPNTRTMMTRQLQDF